MAAECLQHALLQTRLLSLELTVPGYRNQDFLLSTLHAVYFLLLPLKAVTYLVICYTFLLNAWGGSNQVVPWCLGHLQH